ncbi:MAG TPA: hypothetical protein VL832_22720 [Puia sp.]|jgi:hypothetical protein|nr:hypothetical protein [Puia sp.]
MSPSEKIHFKNRLKQFGLSLIGQRIAAAKEAIEQVQQAANQEEKSSAGDKYETGRAMGHLQKDMLARQSAEQTKELANLHAISIETLYPTPAAGAFVSCQGLSFFIAAGLGRQVVDGQTVYFLSPQAPLARALENKKAGDLLAFNSTDLVILEIY